MNNSEKVEPAAPWPEKGAPGPSAGLALIASEPHCTSQARDAGPVDAAALERVRTAAFHLVKSIKVTHLYPSDHTLRRRFTEELLASLEAAFLPDSPLQLLVGKDRLTWEGETVIAGESKEESPLERLYWEGLRLFSFHPGVTAAELGRFLETIAQAQGAGDSGDESLVTLLWARRFPHIRHVAIDDMAQHGEGFDPFGVPAEFLEADSAVADLEIQQSGDTVKLERIGNDAADRLLSRMQTPQDLEVLHVRPDELASLREELADQNDPVRVEEAFFRIIQESLKLAEESSAPGELVAVVASAAVSHLERGEDAAAVRLLEILGGLRRRQPPASPAMLRALEAALALELRPSSLAAWAVRLDAPGEEARRHLPGLIAQLSLDAVPTLCELLGRLGTLHARRRLIDLLGPMAREDPARFARFLTDKRWYLVRNVVLILGQTGLAEAWELAAQALRHHDPRVRKEAMKALSHGDPKESLPLLARALQEKDPTLRLWAARTLGAAGPKAMAPLRAVMESPEFERRSPEERGTFYQSYAYAGREQAVPLFRGMLQPKGLLKSRPPDTIRAALCRALGIAGGGEARTLLEVLGRDRSSAVQEAARSALQQQAAGRTFTLEGPAASGMQEAG